MKPGYKQTEVGVIPAEWELFSLSDLTEPQRPISYGIVQTGPNVANGVRCLRVLDIHEGRINKSELITTSKEISDSYRRTVLKAGDLVMPLRGKVGDVGLVDEELEGANLTRGVALIAIRSGWSPVFCQQVISSTFTRRRLEQAMNGSALQEIPIASLRSFKISTPKALSEQRAIAEALSDVDRLLGGLDRLIAKKRDLKQAAMQQLLSGQTRLPGFRGEWEVKRLGDVIHLIRGGIYGEEKPRARLRASSVATTAHIEMDDTWNNKEMPVRYFTAEKLRDYATVEGDLIVVKSSGSAASIQSGKLGFIDSERAEKFVFSNFLMLLRPTAILPRFLYFYLCSHNVKKLLPTLVEASTYPNIRLGDYLAVEIPVPPLPEQTAIAEVLTEMDAELAALEQRREKTRALKQAMMQELLTGRTRLL